MVTAKVIVSFKMNNKKDLAAYLVCPPSVCFTLASPPLSVVSTCDGGGGGYRRCVVVGVVFVMVVARLRGGGSGGALWLVVEVVGG